MGDIENQRIVTFCSRFLNILLVKQLCQELFETCQHKTRLLVAIDHRT